MTTQSTQSTKDDPNDPPPPPPPPPPRISPFAYTLTTQWHRALTTGPRDLHAWPRAYFDGIATTSTTTNQLAATTSAALSTQLATPLRFALGTGTSLLDAHVLPTCARRAQREVLFVTCFWATASSAREGVAEMLRVLSGRAVGMGETEEGDDEPDEQVDDSRGSNGGRLRDPPRRICVRIGVSAVSVWQRLWRTGGPPRSKILTPEQLGLPPASELPGLDLEIRCLFVRPFSVMHPKFIVVDRELAFLPSCNVSWEDWFEGVVSFEGEMVGRLVEFWEHVWNHGGEPLPVLDRELGRRVASNDEEDLGPEGRGLLASVDLTTCAKDDDKSLTKLAILLPSSHHVNPQFRPWPWRAAPPPPTPLNTFLLHAFTAAQSHLYIQSPNITCPAVLEAILAALQRGVDVRLVTSRKQQLLEQIFTAATTTQFELWKLGRTYRRLRQVRARTLRTDVESAPARLGALNIGWFTPIIEPLPSKVVAEQSIMAAQTVYKEPVKSHFKCVVIDDEVLVLGSGNMDRASWYTSQELGLAILDTRIVQLVRNTVDMALSDRVQWISSAD